MESVLRWEGWQGAGGGRQPEDASRRAGSAPQERCFQVTVSGNGAAALRELEGTRFDCIILDLQLPDMTGFEWLERMEQERLAGAARSR